MRRLDEFLSSEPGLLRRRRTLHGHPETGFDLPATHDFVAAELVALGIPFLPHVGKNSLVGILKNGEGPVLGLRADMDALPVTELNPDLPWRSEVPGKMHACGHDAHTAMLLSAAEFLNGHKDSWKGTVKLIFQEAEEGPNPGGAFGLCRSGFLDDVETFFALHVSPALPSGVLALKEGEMMASADTVKIRLLGKGCHAAYPHLGIDPILMQAETILAFQSIVSRRLDPTESAVLTIARISAGTTHNVIPAFADLEGTVRTFSEATRNRMETEIENVLRGVTSRYGGGYEWNYIREYDPTVNTPESARFFRKTVESALGKDAFVPLEKPTMGAEDFSRYIHLKKGCIAWLGTKKDEATSQSLHHPSFRLDEDALKSGVAVFVNLVENYGKGE